MMISHCGTVWGLRASSYIYAIFTDHFAYIGETGELPPQRWGSHLSKANSSFSQKLSSKLKSFGHEDYDGIFLYIGLHCDIVDQENEDKRKFARCALEHAIHEKFSASQNKFGEQRLLLSSSRPISPRINLGFNVEAIAQQIIDLLSEKYYHSIKDVNNCLALKTRNS